MEKGIFLKVKKGASIWMRERRYWIDNMPNSIDGMIGEVVNDYTKYSGDCCHYELSFDGIPCGVGVHPMWLEASE